MSPVLAELIGTALLVLLGNGVVANVLLKNTKGHGGSWITITCAWGLAVFVSVAVVAPSSGGHINPAVTLALAMSGKFSWSHVPGYWIAQLVGAWIGATLVWLMYRQHFGQTEDGDVKLSVFSTSPAIRSAPDNLLSEVLGTMVLSLVVLRLAAPDVGLGALDAVPVGLLVFAIGLSLGGTTGYAINPARDLGPRLAHFVLPIANKRDSDWRYAWVPVCGPLVGAVCAAILHAVL